jgi:hypothetical protein
MGPYIIKPNPQRPELYDVVRSEPTVVSAALRFNEAEALAFALNAQVKLLEASK